MTSGLIGTAVQTVRVLEAADMLAGEGIAASVLHLPTLKLIDADAIVALAEEISSKSCICSRGYEISRWPAE